MPHKPSYDILEKLPPRAYLKPEDFTGGDVHHPGFVAYQQEQYEKHLRGAENYTEFFISVNGTWGARTKEGGHITSYEGIGYHSATSMILKAIIDSGVPFYVYRWGDEGITKTRIA